MPNSEIHNDRSVWRGVTHRSCDEHVLVRKVTPLMHGAELTPGDECLVLLDLEPQGRLSASPYADRVSLIALEAFRQAGLAAAHVCGGAAQGVVMLANRMGLTWSDQAPRKLKDAICSIRMTEVCHRSGKLHRLVFDADITTGGTSVAHGVGDLTCVPDPVYRRMRRDASPSTTAEHPPPLFTDLELSGHELSARTHWDTSDALVFDHPLDHVPGMHLALAALRVHELLGGADRGAELTFARMAELNRPIYVHATRSQDGSTTVNFSDGSHVLGQACCVGTSSGTAPWAAIRTQKPKASGEPSERATAVVR